MESSQNVFIVPTVNNNVISSAINTEDRKLHVDKLFAEREAQRLADLAARAEKREQEKANHETLDYFTTSFTQEYNSVKAQLDGIQTGQTTSSGSTMDAEILITQLQDSASKVELLQKYLNESTSFLPSRTITQYMAQISSLQTQIGQLKQSSAPKKKFAFKSKKPAPVPTQAAKDTSAEVTSKSISVKPDESAEKDEKVPGIQNISEKCISLEGKDVDRQDLVLENLSQCKIRIYGFPSTVHLLNVSSCEIAIGPVSTSVFLDKCHDSTIVFACQQLRCHQSSRCNLYVHITARGIIEDCSQIYFAPYTFQYCDLVKHFQASNLAMDLNHWKRIDDFNWLSKTEPSPNFSFIPDTEQKDFR